MAFQLVDNLVGKRVEKMAEWMVASLAGLLVARLVQWMAEMMVVAKAAL